MSGHPHVHWWEEQIPRQRARRTLLSAEHIHYIPQHFHSTAQRPTLSRFSDHLLTRRRDSHVILHSPPPFHPQGTREIKQWIKEKKKKHNLFWIFLFSFSTSWVRSFVSWTVVPSFWKIANQSRRSLGSNRHFWKWNCGVYSWWRNPG